MNNFQADITDFYRSISKGWVETVITFESEDELTGVTYLHRVEVNFVDNEDEAVDGSDLYLTRVYFRIAGTDESSEIIIDRTEGAFDHYMGEYIMSECAEAINYTLPSFREEERMDAADFYGER